MLTSIFNGMCRFSLRTGTQLRQGQVFFFWSQESCSRVLTQPRGTILTLGGARTTVPQGYPLPCQTGVSGGQREDTAIPLVIPPSRRGQTLLPVTLCSPCSYLKCVKLHTAQGPYIRLKRWSNCNMFILCSWSECWTREATVSCWSSLYTAHREWCASEQEWKKKRII